MGTDAVPVYILKFGDNAKLEGSVKDDDETSESIVDTFIASKDKLESLPTSGSNGWTYDSTKGEWQHTYTVGETPYTEKTTFNKSTNLSISALSSSRFFLNAFGLNKSQVAQLSTNGKNSVTLFTAISKSLIFEMIKPCIPDGRKGLSRIVQKGVTHIFKRRHKPVAEKAPVRKENTGIQSDPSVFLQTVQQ